MASSTVRISDLSGRPDAVAVSLGYGEHAYEVDLAPDEVLDLEAVLERYLAVARKASVKPRTRRFVPETTLEQRETIRAWARANGHEVANRGKVPNSIYSAYIATQAALVE